MLSHYITKLHHTPPYSLSLNCVSVTPHLLIPARSSTHTLQMESAKQGEGTDMTGPVSNSATQERLWISAVGLLWRDKSGREPGARCWLLAPASSVTTCSGSWAIKSVTPESGAAQASPQRAVSANAILSRKLWGRRRHPESKLYLPYIRNLQNWRPVGTRKEPRMRTTL